MVQLMGANGNSNGGYSIEVWDQILAEWLAGQLSLSDISRTYGPMRSTIRAKAKRFNWPPRGSLADQVRKEVQSQLLDVEGAPASAPPVHADEIIDNAAKRGVAVLRRQRKLLAELLGVAEVALEELREMAVTALFQCQLDGFRQRFSVESKLTRKQPDVIEILHPAIQFTELEHCFKFFSNCTFTTVAKQSWRGKSQY